MNFRVKERMVHSKSEHARSMAENAGKDIKIPRRDTSAKGMIVVVLLIIVISIVAVMLPVLLQ
ncbi:MAG: hypothetical protein FWE07_00100 [Turicibacter sp.]|nr:hypothetical protein [Turicibacter sp.]